MSAESSGQSVIGENELVLNYETRCSETRYSESHPSQCSDDFVPDNYLWIEGYDVGSKTPVDWEPYYALSDFCEFYAAEQEEVGEVEEEEEKDETFVQIFESKKKKPPPPESRRRSLFVHSSPVNFPDVNRARKSVFGSIFLRTTAHAAEDMALLKTVADSSYSTLQSILSSFEKIISAPVADQERRNLAHIYKDSLLKALEVCGISRVYSDGSIHWNIYPIMRDYLYSLQIGDHIHQTRYLSRVEERIVSGPTQKLKMPYEWPTGSVWAGYWDMLGMGGIGNYKMLHGVTFSGKMHDGMFHDTDGILIYPNHFKALHCVYEKGVLKDCQFQFPDLLMHDRENWKYCQFPDRRFWSEVRKGLKPAKIAQKAEKDPPRQIPPGCYDTGDGFYDPVSLMLVDSNLQMLRVPVCKEDKWIKKYCRKGFFEHANFRPDLYENWYDFDQEKIDSILQQHDNYRRGKINFDELHQFYVDNDITPPWSVYRKRKTSSEEALEEHLKSTPSPIRLVTTKRNKDPCRHKIPRHLRAELNSQSYLPSTSSTSNTSKSTQKTSVQEVLHVNKTEKNTESKMEKGKRKIPEKWLKYQPVLRAPFEGLSKSDPSDAEKRRRICQNRSTSSSSSSLPGESSSGMLGIWKKKSLEKHMKKLIMDLVSDILVKERERHRKRLKWAEKPQQKFDTKRETKSRSGQCVKILHELFNSIPDKAEYCDSDPSKVWDLTELAEDKYKMVQYWGTRLFQLDFDESGPGD